MSRSSENFTHLTFRVYAALHGFLLHGFQVGSLGRPEFELLAFLHAYGDSTISEAAEKLRMAKSQLSLNAERLVKKGFVERRRDNTDRRIATIAITGQGEMSLAETFDELNERVERFFEPLEPEQLAAVREAFSIIAELSERSTHS